MTRFLRVKTRHSVIAAVLVFAGIDVLQAQPAAAPVVAPAPAAPLAEPDRPGLTLQEYQKEIATAIVNKSAGQTFQGKLPPLLRSVVVLQVSIDSKGMPENVTMFRSNRFVELEKSAIAAVYRAAPYPIPGRSLLDGHSNITFLESFLFNNDGRFQVRTVAEQQSTKVEPKPRAPRKPDPPAGKK